MAQDCLFCKIAAKQIPSQVVYEDEQIVAFRDIQPQAPVHVVIIPRRHIASLEAAEDTDVELLGRIAYTAKIVAEQLGIATTGYRVVNNCGTHGQQTIQHIHFHLLGGRQLSWPPG
ncbi:MAG TPA: histidine triad nucleotide-binding protein [Firmicutes bacterium]|jgi:histidine triad (HIT) family protein|nr:histidine triad nucleotide-binding protein [Bacillota bacterium]